MKGSKGSRGWTVLSVVLVVLAGILAPLCVVSVWTKAELLNTDRYVASVAPLATDPKVQDQVVARVSAAVSESVDVTSFVRANLPFPALVGPISAQVDQLIERVVREVVESDQFATLWKDVNRFAHTQISALLRGDETKLLVAGRFILDLTPMVEQVRVRLANLGIALFDNVPINKAASQFELFNVETIGKVQQAVDLLERFVVALVIITLVVAAGSVLAARDRRSGARRLAIAILLGGVALAVLLSVGRSLYIDAVSTSTIQSEGRAFEVITRDLRRSARVMFVVGVVGWLAFWPRLDIANRLRSLGNGSFGQFVHQYRNPLRIIGGLLAAFFMIRSDRIGIGDLLVIALIYAAYLAAIELISRSRTTITTTTTAAT
jgi:hypothetical protein